MFIDDKLRAAIDAQKNGQNEKAEKLFWDILKEKPRNAAALFYIGIIRFNCGDFKAALDCIRKSLAINDNNPMAYNFLGLALTSLGELDQAVVSYRQAITLEPQNPDIYNNLADVMLRQGNPDGAIEACRLAICYKPDYFLSHYNLGVSLQQQKKIDDALAAFKQAISLHPVFPEAYCNLGLALMSQGKREEAVAAYKQAIVFKPNFPEAFNNLGQPLSELGRQEEAVAAYRQAVALRPTYIHAYINLAIILRKLGRLTEAIDACRTGLSVVPNHAEAQIELIGLRRHVCDWSAAEADLRQMFTLIQGVQPFLAISSPTSMAQQLSCAQRWSSKIPRGMPFTHNHVEQADRIRIGYLSCDFHLHATAYLMAELFEQHDRSRFEIFGYSYDLDDNSDIRQRIIKGFDHFVDLYSVSDHEAAQQIYKDKINILIDLKGYTQGARTEILVDKPAPVQVNYVGFPGTMGADFIDYIIADPIVAPMKHQSYYSEKIVHLPYCYQPNDTKRPISDLKITRSECGLPEHGFVFCCFNNSYKISVSFFDLWMRLLKAVPHSVLWLISTNPTVETNLRREAAARGVEPQRLIFASAVQQPYHLARHRLADLFLDTLPYGAHTTASDALWAGLPLLTCTGDTFAGRVGTSVLLAVGLPELITTSLDEYESRALEIATHPEMLSELKQKLARNLPTAALFDIRRYTRELESAFVRIWDTWRLGSPLQSFVVDR
jgi:predicted O-linked N-acetylglucosamine transferase (SPINDLY family)